MVLRCLLCLHFTNSNIVFLASILSYCVLAGQVSEHKISAVGIKCWQSYVGVLMHSLFWYYKLIELHFALEKAVLHSDCNSVFILVNFIMEIMIRHNVILTNLTHSWKMYTSLPIWCSGKLSVAHCFCSSLLYSQSMLPPSGSKCIIQLVQYNVWFAKIHVHMSIHRHGTVYSL